MYYVGIINLKIYFLKTMKHTHKFLAFNLVAATFIAVTFIMNGCSVSAGASIHPVITQVKDTSRNSHVTEVKYTVPAKDTMSH